MLMMALRVFLSSGISGLNGPKSDQRRPTCCAGIHGSRHERFAMSETADCTGLAKNCEVCHLSVWDDGLLYVYSLNGNFVTFGYSCFVQSFFRIAPISLPNPEVGSRAKERIYTTVIIIIEDLLCGKPASEVGWKSIGQPLTFGLEDDSSVPCLGHLHSSSPDRRLYRSGEEL